MATKEENACYVESFCEFLEVLIHQVLFLRDLYPKNIFADRKKFGLPVKMSSHPWVNNYVTRTLDSLVTVLKNKNGGDGVDGVVVVVAEEGTGRVVERFVVELEQYSLRQMLGLRDEFLIQLEMTFVSFLLRLTQSVGDLPPPRADSRWWLELSTNQGGALRLTSSLDWCLAATEPAPPRHTSILPVMAAITPIRLQLFIEKIS